MSNTQEKERYARLAERVGEILHYVWDPIGISGAPQTRDEYDNYIPGVVALLMAGKSEEDIARHLYHIEGETMGLTVGSRPSDHTEEVAGMLVEHARWLDTKAIP